MRLLPCLLVLLTALVGCGDQGSTTADSPPVVAVTIHPVATLVERIVGDGADVLTLLPPGRSPHGFEPTPAAVAQLARAEALVTLGLGLDAWADRAVARLDQHPPVLSFASLVNMEDAHAEHAHDHHDHGAHEHLGPNPHLWLDPALARQFVEAITPRLAEALPVHAAQITANSAQLVKQLRALDAEYETALADVPRKELLTFHDAFDRLAERYGLHVVGHLTVLELSPGGEVKPAQLAAAVEKVERFGLPVVYTEPQFSPQVAQAVAEEAGVDVLILDALGGPRIEGYEDYFALMRSNLATLVQGQSAPAEEQGN